MYKVNKGIETFKTQLSAITALADDKIIGES